MASPRTISEAKSPPAAEPQPVAPPEAKPEEKRSKGKPYVILGAIVAVGLAGYGAVSWFSRGRESTDDAQVDADVVAISARVGGAVLKVHVTDNQQVHKGDLLVEIDPADLTAKEKQAEAELAAARAEAAASDAQVHIVVATSKGGLSAAQAQLSGTATSVASAGAQIEAAKAALAHAQAEASRADVDLARAVSLRKDEAVPQAQVDTAGANAQAAHAAVAQASAQLAAAEDARRTAQTQIAEAKGRVEQSAPIDAQLSVAQANADLAHARADAAEASLAEAKLQLSYTRISAPADGLLSRLAVHEGQLVQAGQQVVGVVPDATYVVANFKETQVGNMRAGQRAEISVDALPGRSFEGKVESTSPGTGARFSLLPADNASGNFVKVVQRLPVKIAWVNVPADVKLAAGLSVDVTVLTQ
ncbi:MAG TPA: HlyD family secretion protein [Polyangiaceae bacterium]|nr:HlyD family secretion protein [Polyangiaceae bacterium]